MRFIYPAVIRKNGEEDYEAWVPDLAGCRARGFSVDDVMNELNAATLDWITLELEEPGASLPSISDKEALEAKAAPNEMVRNVCVTYRSYDGWDE